MNVERYFTRKMEFRTMELYEQLWNVSYDSLKKNCIIACTLTSILQKRAEHLRSQLSFPNTTRSKTFPDDFRKAYNELLSMCKSVQGFVSEWQEVFFTEDKMIMFDEGTSSVDFEFDYIKLPMLYEKDQIIKLLVTDVPRTTQEVFCAVDQGQSSHFSRFGTLQHVAKSPLAQLPPAGKVFAIRLENIWFRAVRNRIVCNEAAESIAICLLDSGEVLPYDSSLCIANLPAEFQAVPAYFMKCRMVLGENPALFKRFDVISCKVVNVDESDILRVAQIPESEPIKKEVERTEIDDKISTENEPNGEQIPSNQALLEFNDPQLPESQSNEKGDGSGKLYAISRDTLSKEDLEQFDDLPESTTNAMKAILGYVPKDDLLICKHYDPNMKRCFKGSNCRQRHIEMDPDGWTRDRDTVSVSVSTKMEIPSPNTFITLVPTMVIDFELFYSQIVPNGGLNQQFSQLTEDLNNPKVMEHYKLLKLLPTVGELVLAKYENAWYRAQVCELFDKTVSVFYVDYGNVETLLISELRVCDDRFKHLPFQAVCCRIANARHLKPYHIEAIEQFTAAILDKHLKALIIDNKTPWEVQIFDEDGFDIGHAMTIAKLALPRTPSKIDDEARLPG